MILPYNWRKMRMLRAIKEYESQKKKILKKMPKFEAKPQKEFGAILNDFQKFNQAVGFPINRNTGLPQQMTKYQIQYYDAVKKYHQVIVNKSRKIGATEAALRIIAMNCLGRYAGHDVMIVAGNELRISKEFLKRVNELFMDKKDTGFALVDPSKDGNKWKRDELVRRISFGNTPEIEFKNDTRIMAFAAQKSTQSQSFRGIDDVACIFISEAAHTGLKKDHIIMTALEPNLANRDDGDFIIESTPNGRRGFFYDFWKASMDVVKKKFHENDDVKALQKLHQSKGVSLDWYPLMWDYRIGLRHKVLSKKFIEREKTSPKLDFEQEYCCKFTSTYSAAILAKDLRFKDTTTKDYEPSIDLLDAIGRDYSNSKLHFYNP